MWPPVGDAVEGAVVEVGHLGVVSVDEVVEHVVDAQLQLVLLEEGQDLLNVRSVLDVRLRPSQDLEDRLSRYRILLLIRPQQGLLAVVVERVDPALAHVMVVFL